MTILVVGASGATGRLLVEHLLNCDHKVKIIVRSLHSIPVTILKHKNLSVIVSSILGLHDKELQQHVKGYQDIVSCLGHNISFKGIYGSPRWLVTHATKRLCHAIKANKPQNPVKFVLMNTAVNSNRDMPEVIPFVEKLVIWLLRMLLPPHVDNEKASDYLRCEIGQNNPMIEWSIVRPDTLINAAQVSDYDLYVSPTRSSLFNSGITSRVNVAYCMADLIINSDIWEQWKGKMSVIYNRI